MYCSREEVSLFIPQQENLNLELCIADNKENSNRIMDFLVVKYLCLYLNISFKNFPLLFPLSPAPLQYYVVMASTTSFLLLVKLQKRAQSLNEDKSLKVVCVGNVSKGLSHRLIKAND